MSRSYSACVYMKINVTDGVLGTVRLGSDFPKARHSGAEDLAEREERGE